MSVQSHLAELERRHKALESLIAKEERAPAINDRQVSELKKKKLLLKDEIARLRNAPASTVH